MGGDKHFGPMSVEEIYELKDEEWKLLEKLNAWGYVGGAILQEHQLHKEGYIELVDNHPEYGKITPQGNVMLLRKRQTSVDVWLDVALEGLRRLCTGVKINAQNSLVIIVHHWDLCRLVGQGYDNQWPLYIGQFRELPIPADIEVWSQWAVQHTAVWSGEGASIPAIGYYANDAACQYTIKERA